MNKYSFRTIPNEVFELADLRKEAKQEKDWERADALREEIATKGFVVKDTKAGEYELSPM